MQIEPASNGSSDEQIEIFEVGIFRYCTFPMNCSNVWLHVRVLYARNLNHIILNQFELREKILYLQLELSMRAWIPHLDSWWISVVGLPS
jgi:hypothetical protein